MDITAIDRSATSGRSALHEASPAAKLIAFALVLSAVIVSWNVLVLAAVALVLVAAAAASRLDLRLALGLAAYPGLFAAVFAFASAPNWGVAWVIVLKAVTAALAAVVLVLTTPYPQVFAPVQRILPGIAGDALLVTYRTFFLLAERFSHLLRSVRLRSGGDGRHQWLRTARVVSSALGNLVLYAFDLAERDYDVMYLRGYSGRLRVASHHGSRPALDAAVIALAAVAAVTCAVWRLGWQSLNPYSWIPTVVGLLALAAALVWRWTRGQA